MIIILVIIYITTSFPKTGNHKVGDKIYECELINRGIDLDPRPKRGDKI